MIMKTRFREGAWFAAAIAAALVFIPPLFAHKLDGWNAAKELLPAEQALVAACGKEMRVDLSRWFYTYQFSGDNAEAKFRGRVTSPSCDRGFTVELRSRSDAWKVTKLSMT